MIRQKRQERKERKRINPPPSSSRSEEKKQELALERKGFLFHDPYPTYRQLLARTEDEKCFFGVDTDGISYLKPWQEGFKRAFALNDTDSIVVFFAMPPNFVQVERELVTDRQGIVRQVQKKSNVVQKARLPNMHKELVIHNKFLSTTKKYRMTRGVIPQCRQKCGHAILKLIR